MNGFGSLGGLALLLVRPGMLVIATPLFGASYAPANIRLGLTIILALLVAPVVAVPSELPATGLAVVVLREVAIGLALGMAIRIIVMAADLAGHFTGYQIGLSMGSLIDPQSGVRNNILAVLYANLATVICFGTNAHHAFIRALVASYEALPIGVGALSGSLPGTIASMLGVVFVLGVRIAMPVVVVLLLVELALGLLPRVAPSLNMMTAGAPVRLLVGLLIVAATLSTLPSVVRRYMPTVTNLSVELSRALR
jgi:flagellar biosynthesis protein FliR